MPVEGCDDSHPHGVAGGLLWQPHDGAGGLLSHPHGVPTGSLPPLLRTGSEAPWSWAAFCTVSLAFSAADFAAESFAWSTLPPFPPLSTRVGALTLLGW